LSKNEITSFEADGYIYIGEYLVVEDEEDDSVEP